MPRVNKTFSIDLANYELLEKRAKETGTKLSRLVDDGIAMVLGKPLEPALKDADDEFPETRSEKIMLQVLKGRDPGWHHTCDLAKDAGLTTHIARKALKALARAGKVHQWGEGRQNYDGTWQGAWGMRPALDVCKTVIAKMPPNPAVDAPEWEQLEKCHELLKKLALGMSEADVLTLRQLVLEHRSVDGKEWELEDFDYYQTFAERARRESEELTKAREELEAKTQAEWKRQREEAERSYRDHDRLMRESEG